MRTKTGPDGQLKRSFIEEARRAQIVEAATRTVAEVGYARASLAQIAETAGISKSVISYHFDGKDELLEQVARQYLDDAWAAMQPHLAAAATPTERIRAWVGSQMAYFAASRQGFLAMSEIVTNHRRPDGTRPFEGLDEEEVEALTAILAEGQRHGEFRPADPRAVALAISQTVEGALGRWAYDDEGFDIEAQIPVLVDFVEHAIRAEAS